MSALLPSATLFEQHQIRRLYDDATETWWFSVVDIVQAHADSTPHVLATTGTAERQRLAEEGSQSVTNVTD